MPPKTRPAARQPAGQTEDLCHDCHQPLLWTKKRCVGCLKTHNAKSRERRAEIAAAILTLERREQLLELLAASTDVAAACNTVGVNSALVYGYRTYDALWGEQLDNALTAGRDPDLNHGTLSAYREGKCRCPECRAAKAADRGARTVPEQSTAARQRAFIATLRAGYPLGPARDRLNVTGDEYDAWTGNAAFMREVKEAGADYATETIRLAVEEIRAGRPVTPLLLARGLYRSWLTNQAARDENVAALVREARQQRDEAARAARLAAPTTPDKAPTAQQKEREAADAAKAAQGRQRLRRLIPLLEAGATIRGAARKIGLTPNQIETLRKRVPEAEAKIRSAYQTGARDRAQQQRREAHLRAQGADDGAPEQIASRLIVAAVAAGQPLERACKAAGAHHVWVYRRYQRHDAFRQALTAAAALNPNTDLHGWLESEQDHDWGGTGIPGPRPPRDAK